MKKHARQGFEHHYKNVCFRLKIIALFFSESCSGLGECEHVLQVFAPANTITPGLGGVLGQTTSPWAGPAHGWASRVKAIGKNSVTSDMEGRERIIFKLNFYLFEEKNC